MGNKTVIDRNDPKEKENQNSKKATEKNERRDHKNTSVW
jgi:hypothetical protein